jgi:serine/threonine protein kinase
MCEYRSKAVVAVKELIIMERKGAGGDQLHSLFHEFRQEAFVWSRLSHPNILQLVGVCVRPLCFVMELASNDTLTHYLHSHPKTLWSDRIRYAHDIAKGLAYLHSLDPPIIHRDLKGINVLVVT